VKSEVRGETAEADAAGLGYFWCAETTTIAQCFTGFIGMLS